MARRPVQAPSGRVSEPEGEEEVSGVRGALTGDSSASLVDAVFGAGGLLSQKFESYEPRPGQVEMSRAVERAITKRETLIVEAPTGVGKSLGYLVPAIGAKGRTLVVTANIALQEQLVKKDLPLLAEILPEPFAFALAKGISNYACIASLEEAERQGVGRKLPIADREQWDSAQAWLAETKSGDLSELDFEPSPLVRQWLTTSSDDCPGSHCRKAAGCHALAARAAWHSSTVLVTNYHLFFIDLAIRSKGAPGVLPEYETVVFDEAHKAADIARDFFGFRITERAISNLAKAVSDPAISHKLEASAVTLFRQLRAHRDSDRYKARIKVARIAPEASTTRDLLDEAARKLDHQAKSEASDNESRHKLRQRAQRCRDLSVQLGAAHELAEGSVYFLSGEKEKIALESKLVDVSDVLAENLFNQRKAVVLTSATLAATRDDFSLVKRELGIEQCRELTVDSPFDFSRATIVVPEMPDPRDRDYAERVARAVEQCVRRAEGRTLALFTSWRILNATHNHLVRIGLPYRVMRQGEAPRTELVRRFREDVSSVLLGVESFWAGVDVPGESLSCVVIDRLPFMSPEDPVLDAMTELDPKGWFYRFSLPRAIVQLKQGFGRLIRSSSDRGVVVLLDNRVHTKPYGNKFLEALPESVNFGDQFEAIDETLG